MAAVITVQQNRYTYLCPRTAVFDLLVDFPSKLLARILPRLQCYLPTINIIWLCGTCMFRLLLSLFCFPSWLHRLYGTWRLPRLHTLTGRPYNGALLCCNMHPSIHLYLLAWTSNLARLPFLFSKKSPHKTVSIS